MLIEMFTRPLFAIGLPGHAWAMFALTTIVMITGGAPFLKSAWAALRSHNANMDTLIALGTSTAYLYSLYAMVHHQPVFFEVAAFVITFILLGQVLEDTMKGRANSAIEKLLDLQAKDAEVIRNGKPLIVPLADIITGDIIRVKPGQKIAVDGIVTGCILAVGRIVGERAALLYTAGFAHTLYGGLRETLESSGATLSVALYVYAKEQGEFEVAFAIAAILMVLALLINLAATLTGRYFKKRRSL